MTVRNADDRLFEVAVFETYGAQHRTVRGAGYARSDDLGAPVKVCHLDVLLRLLNNESPLDLYWTYADDDFVF
jgi:hypothetical protein